MRVRVREPEFEAVNFRFDVLQPTLFTEIFGYPCEKRAKDRVLLVDKGDEHPTIVPEGWWFVQDRQKDLGGNATCFVMSDEVFKRAYQPLGPEELF